MPAIEPLAAPASAPAAMVRTIESFDGLRTAWQALDERGDNPFTTWEWATTWWEHFGHGRPSLRVVADDGGGIRGILPLYETRIGPMRALRFIGHGAGDCLGPAGDATDTRLAADALNLVLRSSEPGWRILLAERLPGDAGLDTLPGARVLQRTASPVVDLAGGWEDVAASFGRKLRKEISRKERVLARDHRVVFRRTDEAERFDADFDVFLTLHAARWPGGQSSLLPKAAFHRAFARQALERGWLQLWILEADGRPVAARYDFALGGHWYAYNAGRDPAWQRESLGLLLRAHTIREAIALGATTYHLLRGDEPYKDRLATRDPGLVTVAVGRGVLGRVAVRAGSSMLSARRARQLAARAVTP
jgi:CelD/BcsL family acetyltransferase involved in cellulose biosynthesis